MSRRGQLVAVGEKRSELGLFSATDIVRVKHAGASGSALVEFLFSAQYEIFRPSVFAFCSIP